VKNPIAAKIANLITPNHVISTGFFEIWAVSWRRVSTLPGYGDLKVFPHYAEILS